MNDFSKGIGSICGLRCVALALISVSTSLFAQPYALYAEGDVFVQSDVGSIELGFPNNGNQWRLSTASDGQNLIFQHKPIGAISAQTQFTFDGDTGYFGIGGTPTARTEIFQQSQTVGTGLRFDDGTANSDWDITHGFALRFHYGGSLRGFINANTGAYTQSSDRRLKEAARPMPTVLSKVAKLVPLMYRYKDDRSHTEVTGLMAQDVLSLFPSLVTYSEPDDLYGVDYAGFSVVAIKAIQELHVQLDSKENRILSLEQRIDDIERQLNCSNPGNNYFPICRGMTLSQAVDSATTSQ